MKQKGLFDDENDKPLKGKQPKPQQMSLFSQREMLEGQIKHFDTSRAVTRDLLKLEQGTGGAVYYPGDLTPYLRELVAVVPAAINDAAEMSATYKAARQHFDWHIAPSSNAELVADGEAVLLYILRAVILCEWRTGIDVRALIVQLKFAVD